MLPVMEGNTTPQTMVHGPGGQDMTSEEQIVAAFTRNWALGVQAWGASLGGRSQRTDAYLASAVDRPAFIVNTVVLLKPPQPGEVDAVMADLDDFYGFSRGTRTGRVFLFSVWDTPDLTAHGWTGRRHPPLMHRPAGGQASAVPAGLTVRATTDAATLHAAEQVTLDSFGIADPHMHRPQALFGAALLDEPRMPMWVGREGDRVVSTAATFVAHGVNNVINVATLPEARGRGYGTAVTWPATLADPSMPTVLVASDLGAPVYERMGYTTVRPITAWNRISPKSVTPAQPPAPGA